MSRVLYSINTSSPDNVSTFWNEDDFLKEFYWAKKCDWGYDLPEHECQFYFEESDAKLALSKILNEHISEIDSEINSTLDEIIELKKHKANLILAKNKLTEGN